MSAGCTHSLVRSAITGNEYRILLLVSDKIAAACRRMKESIYGLANIQLTARTSDLTIPVEFLTTSSRLQ